LYEKGVKGPFEALPEGEFSVSSATTIKGYSAAMKVTV